MKTETKPKPKMLAGFDAVCGLGIDPKQTTLVLPMRKDGKPTKRALRMFAAILKEADK